VCAFGPAGSLSRRPVLFGSAGERRGYTRAAGTTSQDVCETNPNPRRTPEAPCLIQHKSRN
jgi:hypothetical protein